MFKLHFTIMKIPKNLISKIYIFYLFKHYALTGFLSLTFNKLIYGSLLKIGKNPKVWGSFTVKIIGKGTIVIGENLHFVSEPKRSFITLYSKIQLTSFGQGSIVIGDHVGLNGTVIVSKKSIFIGNGSMIAPNVIIVDSDFHNPWPASDRFISSTETFDKPVRIGENVWIGMNSIILKGSVIGDNSIIAAGSIVNGEIPPNCIAGGNPARVISFSK